MSERNENDDDGAPATGSWAPFDEGRRERFLEAIRGGCRSNRQACKLLGLCRSTVNKWIARGRQLELTDDDGEPYRAFYLQLQMAEAASEMRPWTALHQAVSGGNWRAADSLAKLEVRRMQAQTARMLAKANVKLTEANARLAAVKADQAESKRKALADMFARPKFPMSDDE